MNKTNSKTMPFDSNTLIRFGSIGFVAVVFGLLMIQQFDQPVQVQATVIETVGSSSFAQKQSFRRGSIIETTQDEFLKIQIDDVEVALAQNTTIELHRLFTDERVIRLIKGRIVVQNPSRDPFFVETHETESMVLAGTATIVNYDFLNSVTIAPLKETVQVRLKSSQEYLLLPVAVTIQEYPVLEYQAAEINLNAGDGAKFYNWLGY